MYAHVSSKSLNIKFPIKANFTNAKTRKNYHMNLIEKLFI